MNFSPQQEAALEAVRLWLSNGDSQVFRMFGYAGTGKTTLAKYLDACLYAAFTGKAAHVLRQKGCASATTIHSLIYHPKEKSRELLAQLLEQRQKLLDEELPVPTTLERKIVEERRNVLRPLFSLNTESELGDAKLLVIDECSMVGEEIGQDLLSFGTKILVLGDPAQLPPIASGGFFTDHEPDVLLTEVHRQARENPILELATLVRETGRMPRSHPCVIRNNGVTHKRLTQADQLIVGRNVTRHYQNMQIRQLLGFQDVFPEVDERVVCLRNNHQLGLMNGATYTVTDTPDEGMMELDGHLLVDFHPEYFTEVGVEGAIPWYMMKEREHFDFGYALTCHKSQGSQWPSVGIINESSAFREHAQRWLYTAITRASDKLWVTR